MKRTIVNALAAIMLFAGSAHLFAQSDLEPVDNQPTTEQVCCTAALTPSKCCGNDSCRAGWWSCCADEACLQ